MKTTTIIAMLLLTINSFSQKIDISLLPGEQWMLVRGQGVQQTYIRDAKDITDNITILFKKSGDFSWSSNPSCGTHIGESRGTGEWSYDEKENILRLDFRNVKTSVGETRGIEKYIIISLTKDQLVLTTPD